MTSKGLSLSDFTVVPGFAGSTSGSVARTVALICSITFLTALGAHAKIFLPFTPVPVTMQTMAVMLAGLVLAPWAAAVSQILYVVMGMAGLPFLAAIGSGTWGYLLGFIVAAPLISFFARRGHETAGCFAGIAVIHACGCTGLAVLGMPVGLPLLVAGSLPFIPGDILKMAAAIRISRAV